MLRLYQAIAAIALVFLLLSFLGLGYYSSPPSGNPSEQQSAAEQKGTEQRQESGKGLAGFWGWLFKDSISVFTLWLTLATIALSVIAVLQIGYLERAERLTEQNAKAAKDSAETARDALIAANRPWIKADLAPGAPITYDVNGIRFTVKFTLKNIGHSPATNVFTLPVIKAPTLSSKGKGLDARAELRGIIKANKQQTWDLDLGITLFPDEIAVQNVTAYITKDDLASMTQTVNFILPTLVGTVIYKMGLDTKIHQTGYIAKIRRKASPNKERSASAIFPDEGAVPEDNIVLESSILEGGYAD